jgi:hypothetical protein
MYASLQEVGSAHGQKRVIVSPNVVTVILLADKSRHSFRIQSAAWEKTKSHPFPECF